MEVEQQKGEGKRKREREGEGEKSSSSPPRKRAKTHEDLIATTSQESKEAKSVYLFATHFHGPIAHTLYVVDTCPPRDASTLIVDDDSPMRITLPETGGRPLNPLVEFPRAEYPLGMCAVEFDSKLYILGGEFDDTPSLRGPPRVHDDFCPFPRDVHIFDPSSASSLKVGPKMNTGKFKPTAFVADSMIYVVSACLAVSYEDSLSRFEVFKPVNDDCTGGSWTRLEDPPFGHTLFTGHAVINRQVFFSTLNDDFLCFDLDSSRWWRKIWGEDRFPCWTKLLTRKENPFWDPSFWVGGIRPPFRGCPKLTEDGTLYSCYEEFNVASFGQLVANNDNRWKKRSEREHEEKMFDRVNLLLPGVIQIPCEIVDPCVHFAYLGQRLFCHVVFGNPMKTTTHPNPSAQDRTICYANLTMFEASEDTCCSEDMSSTFFRGKLLQSALFVITTKGYTLLSDAFTLPSLGRAALHHSPTKVQDEQSFRG
jgi:hypothetical protein